MHIWLVYGTEMTQGPWGNYDTPVKKLCGYVTTKKAAGEAHSKGYTVEKITRFTPQKAEA